MPLQDDWLKRMTSGLARALARAMGLRAKGQLDEALQATQDDSGDLLGMPRHVLDGVAPRSAAMMLPDPKRRDAYAQLLEADAATYEAMGRPDDAAALRARVRELRG